MIIKKHIESVVNVLQNISCRYTNILPYDANRVQLNEAINGTDYINASWISKGTPPGARMPNACTGASFIAAQGPTVKTSPSYLQMIYENKVDIIVMLTNFIEQTKTGIITRKNSKPNALVIHLI